MCSDTTFSKILVTTRNPTLDRLVTNYPGVSLGGDPAPKELERTQLRFGVVNHYAVDNERTPLMKHTAFGLEKETEAINWEVAQEAHEAQKRSDVELGSRGPFFNGSGLGALPG